MSDPHSLHTIRVNLRNSTAEWHGNAITILPMTRPVRLLLLMALWGAYGAGNIHPCHSFEYVILAQSALMIEMCYL